MTEFQFKDHEAELEDLLLFFPGVTRSRSFGRPAYLINGKVFCVLQNGEISVKLPPTRVEQLAQKGGPFRRIQPQRSASDRQAEWLAFDRSGLQDVDTVAGLFEESIYHSVG